MKTLILTALSLISYLGFAQIPSGYYNGTQNLTGQALKDKLNDIISDHTELSYNAVKTALKNTDEDPNNPNNVILLYKGTSQSKNSFGGGANDWNREHVWAKSHGNFGNNKPAGTDLHHLRPTDASVNSSRGNKEFDFGGTPHSEATQCKSDGDSWEPRNAVKGDIARMLFYMATRYEGEAGEIDLELNESVNNGSAPFHGKFSTLLQWHLSDPVDNFEKNRNNEIYAYQNNRNPFIDHPEFVNKIWSTQESVNFLDVKTNSPIVYHLDFVQWKANIDITGGYDEIYLQIGNNSGMYTDSLKMNFVNNEFKSVGVKQYNFGEQIFYRARVKTLSGNNYYSTEKNFIVQNTIGIKEYFPYKWSINNNIFTIRNSSENIKITVLNVLGKQELVSFNKTVNFNNLPKGTYLIKTQNNKKINYLKINN